MASAFVAQSLLTPFTISLGKVHAPNHYFLLDPCGPQPLVPRVRGNDGLYTGCVQVVDLHGSNFVAKVTDLPYGTLGENSCAEVKRAVSSLGQMCAFLGIDGRSNALNRCAVVHIMAALFRGDLIRVADVCKKIDTEQDEVVEQLPLGVLDAVDDYYHHHRR